MLSSYIITDSGILLVHNSQHYSVSSDHSRLTEIKEALANEQYDLAVSIMNLREVVKQFLTEDETFTLENDLIVLDNRPFSDAVTDKVMKMIQSGNKALPLFEFLRNLRSNPSKSAQDELILFCVSNNFMITDDGAILAYKSVKGDYTDIHSGSVLNKPTSAMTPEEYTDYLTAHTNDNGVTVQVINGVTTVSMHRNDVDDRRHVTCSDGLHFAAFGYASTWAGAIDGEYRKLMLMKVHPRDVVSIPIDYNNQKGRCCQYEVLDEIMPTVISDGIMHIEPLPHQEVFSIPVREQSVQVARRESLEAEIDRLENDIYELQSVIEEQDARHNEIYDLGGEPTDDERAENSRMEDDIAAMREELTILESELEGLDSF